MTITQADVVACLETSEAMLLAVHDWYASREKRSFSKRGNVFGFVVDECEEGRASWDDEMEDGHRGPYVRQACIGRSVALKKYLLTHATPMRYMRAQQIAS